MATITTLNSGDSGPVSRGVINTNLANLNSDKIETSVISTDGTLASNSDAKLPSEKAVKTYVDANTFSVETTAGTTHALTTVASQQVLVTAKGVVVATNAVNTVTLKYNGVTKDTVTVGGTGAGASLNSAFALMYTETPGAATQNVTVETSGGTLSNVVIVVQKL